MVVPAHRRDRPLHAPPRVELSKADVLEQRRAEDGREIGSSGVPVKRELLHGHGGKRETHGIGERDGSDEEGELRVDDTQREAEPERQQSRELHHRPRHSNAR